MAKCYEYGKMTDGELSLDYIIRHRGEPECDLYITQLSKKMDNEVVEETLCHIWAGFYDAENPIEITIRQIAKQCYALKRDRKIAENRRHYAKLCEKRMNMEGSVD